MQRIQSKKSYLSAIVILGLFSLVPFSSNAQWTPMPHQDITNVHWGCGQVTCSDIVKCDIPGSQCSCTEYVTGQCVTLVGYLPHNTIKSCVTGHYTHCQRTRDGECYGKLKSCIFLTNVGCSSTYDDYGDSYRCAEWY